MTNKLADDILDSLKSPERTSRVDRALRWRQPGLVLVIENVHDPHNFNALLRSADAAGVLRVCTIYTIERMPRLGMASSTGVEKWLEIERFSSVGACFAQLRNDGFRILATKLEPMAKPLYENDLTQPTAIVLGNEHRGISDQVAREADDLLYIPMLGMAESLNVSVASAVCLFEAMRQRREKGMYDAPQLSPEGLRSKKLEWLMK